MDEIITAETITKWLDQLAEFEAKRDGLAAQKAELLEQNKVPEDIKKIVADGTQRMNSAPLYDAEFEKSIAAELNALEIPEEIREQLAKIDAARNAIEQKRTAHQAELWAKEQQRRAAIQAEIEAATADVYAKIATRKAEIEQEFSGSLDAVNKNIDGLKARIKAETIKHGETVRGKFYMQVFTKGRTTWITDALDGCYFDMNGVIEALDKYLTESSGSLLDIRATLTKIVKALSSARKVGEPSSALKRVQ